MMISPRIVLLLSLIITAAAAWSLPNVPTSSRTSTITEAQSAVAPSNNQLLRRTFIFETTAALFTASTVLPLATMMVNPKPASAAAATKSSITPDAALTQWKASVVAIDTLLDRWDSLAGGDAIRKELGTANFGTETSPLFQIQKAFKVLRDNDDSISDLVEFTEQSEEFTNALNRADTMAYSANFAGGSGKPTPPKVYTDKAKIEVQDMKRIAKSISSLLVTSP